MKGYWKKPARNRPPRSKDGWYYSWRRRHHGQRKASSISSTALKDMIISGGENVYSAEVENVISLMPRVGEVAVIGIPDER